MTKMKNYTDRLHGEGASGIMELQKSNDGGGIVGNDLYLHSLAYPEILQELDVNFRKNS